MKGLVASCVAVLILTIARSSRANSTSAYPASSLVDLAKRMATTNHDPKPTWAAYVVTTRQAAMDSARAGGVDSKEKPMYFVVLRGHFRHSNSQ